MRTLAFIIFLCPFLAIGLRAAPMSILKDLKKSYHPEKTDQKPAAEGVYDYKDPEEDKTQPYKEIEHPKLNRDQIDHAAKTCQQKVDNFWKKRTTIQRQNLPDFQRAMGNAQKACTRLHELSKTLQDSDSAVVDFDDNMSVAQKAFE